MRVAIGRAAAKRDMNVATEEGERELKLGQEGWSKQDYGSSKNK